MGDDIARDVAMLRAWAESLPPWARQGPWAGGVGPVGAAVLRVLAFLENQSQLCVALAERAKAVRAEEREKWLAALVQDRTGSGSWQERDFGPWFSVLTGCWFSSRDEAVDDTLAAIREGK